jgi:hypothetical protein
LRCCGNKLRWHYRAGSWCCNGLASDWRCCLHWRWSRSVALVCLGYICRLCGRLTVDFSWCWLIARSAVATRATVTAVTVAGTLFAWLLTFVAGVGTGLRRLIGIRRGRNGFRTIGFTET